MKNRELKYNKGQLLKIVEEMIEDGQYKVKQARTHAARNGNANTVKFYEAVRHYLQQDWSDEDMVCFAKLGNDNADIDWDASIADFKKHYKG